MGDHQPLHVDDRAASQGRAADGGDVTVIDAHAADRVQRLPSAIDRLALPGIEPPSQLLEYLRTFDSIVSWYGSNQPEFRARVQELELPFTFFPALPGSDDRTHVVDFFLTLAGAP